MTPRPIVQNEFYVCPRTLLKNREPTAWTVKSVNVFRGYQTLIFERGLQQRRKNIVCYSFGELYINIGR